MGFNMLFYIIFGINLLTEGPVRVSIFLSSFRVLQKRNTQRSPNGMKPSRSSFLDQKQTRRLGDEVGDTTRRPQGRRARPRGRARPHPRGSLVAPLTQFLRLYIPKYPQTTRGIHENTFPLPQCSIPVRSSLGGFSSILPEGDSIMEGFYINVITLPMKHEQFTMNLRVHSQQLDGFFSLFASQYHVLLMFLEMYSM